VTDRHIGYVVILEHSVREDDAAAIVTALSQIRGVESVEPVTEAISQDAIVTMRERARFFDVLLKLAQQVSSGEAFRRT
jgi:hypothetical protein